jgi:hypothetical protein
VAAVCCLSQGAALVLAWSARPTHAMAYYATTAANLDLYSCSKRTRFANRRLTTKCWCLYAAVSTATGTVYGVGDVVKATSSNRLTEDTARSFTHVVAIDLPNQGATGSSAYTTASTCVGGSNCLG